MAIYYNRFLSDKQWDKILFVGGRPLQSAELNEIQSLGDDKLKRLGDMFISDGSVISGCNITAPTSFPGTAGIAEGYIYVGGKIIHTPGATVVGNFTGSGIEYIYLNVTNTIVTENDDTSLNDPAIEEPNFGLPGAHRQILNLNFTNADNKVDSSIKFGRLVNGIVVFKFPEFGGDKVVKVMEQRTFDESGHYLVSGGNLKLLDVTDDTQYLIQLEPFEAYLSGKEFNAAATQSVQGDKAIETWSTQDIATISQNIGSSSSGTNNVFKIHNKFVERAQTCIYPVRETLSIVHPIAGGTDALGIDGSIAQVLSVTRGATTYTVDVDYNIDYVDVGIDWSPPSPGIEPPVGSTYQVDVVYYLTVTLSEGEDYLDDRYTVEYPFSSQGDYSIAYLVITDSRYDSDPSRQSNVINVEYTAYKYRIDAVVLDITSGLMSVINGDYSNTLPIPNPKVTNSMFLMYLITPNPGVLYAANTFKVEDKRVFRITQAGFNTMKSQIETIHESLMFSQLDNDAANTPVTGLMNGIYTDTFETQDQSDIGFLGNSTMNFSEPFNAGFDDATLTLSLIINQTAKDPDVSASTLSTNKTAYTLGYTEVLEIEQKLATHFISVQPYAIPQGGAKLEVSPMNDLWIDEHQDVITTAPKAANTQPQTKVQPKQPVKHIVGRPDTAPVVRGLKAAPNTAKTQGQVWPSGAFGITTSVAATFNAVEGVATKTAPNLALMMAAPVAQATVLAQNTRTKGVAAVKPLNPGAGTINGLPKPSPAPATPTPAAPTATPVSKVIPYARKKKLHIKGTYWWLYGDVSTYTLSCTMAGINVPGFSDNIKLKSDYSFEGDFIIPDKVPAGIIPVRVWTNPFSLDVTTNYFAEGLIMYDTRTDREVTTTVRETVVVVQPEPTPTPGPPNGCVQRLIARFKGASPGQPVPAGLIDAWQQECARDPNTQDPIAETILPDQDMFISSIGLFFKAKDSQAPVYCYIMGVANGYPDKGQHLSCATLFPDQVNVSNDGSAETIFTFPDPVFVSKGGEYAIVVRSTSTSYLIFVAKQGENDILSNKVVISQPYVGVFFESSNASAWTAYQDIDLKFNVYRPKFNSTGTLVLDTQTINDSWLMVMADIAEHGNTNCRIYYYNTSTTDWTELKVAEKRKITPTNLLSYNNLHITMDTDDEYLSPVMSQSIGTLYWHYDSMGEYYSETIDFREGNEFDRVKIRISGIPTTTWTVNIAVSCNNVNWARYNSSGGRCTLKTKPIDLNINLYEYDYEFDISDSFYGLNLARYLKINIEMGTVDWSGNDTCKLLDLRTVVYEAI
jgi:hypothetical protein